MADLKISRSSLERSRKRLKMYGILNFKSVRGTANITYLLTDLETIFRNRNNQSDTTGDATCDAGIDATIDATPDQLNKNSKPKPKQIVVADYATAFNFFADTGNCRLLKEKFGLDDNAIAGFFKTFYDSKIDLGDLNNKTLAETARNFYYWLPKHLAAGQNEKEKSCAKKESYHQPHKAQPIRGVAAAMNFAGVKMRGE
jgi:Tol biopolymer transport system component